MGIFGSNADAYHLRVCRYDIYQIWFGDACICAMFGKFHNGRCGGCMYLHQCWIFFRKKLNFYSKCIAYMLFDQSTFDLCSIVTFSRTHERTPSSYLCKCKCPVFGLIIALRTAKIGEWGQISPRASSFKLPHNTQCFRIWGPHKVNQQYFSKVSF